MQTLSAHAVVCTLPLGCLQRGGVAFDPPLPGGRTPATPPACLQGAVGSGLIQFGIDHLFKHVFARMTAPSRHLPGQLAV